jgi:hypothetical protein
MNPRGGRLIIKEAAVSRHDCKTQSQLGSAATSCQAFFVISIDGAGGRVRGAHQRDRLLKLVPRWSADSDRVGSDLGALLAK